jgi:hypothetical protein
VITGYFGGIADFNPGTGVFSLSSAGSADVFISRLDLAGNFVWAGRVGGSSNDKGFDIAVALDGSLYITGFFATSADFDPGPASFTLSGGIDAFILQLDPACNFAWARHFGSSYLIEGFAIALGNDGSSFCTGIFGGTADFDPGSGTFSINSTTINDSFILKSLPDHSPTNVSLSAAVVLEAQAVGAVVGNFTTQDPDPGEAFTYSLVSGAGGDDNSLFAVSSSGQLTTAAVLDFEAKSSYSIRVRTTDYSGMRLEKIFTITATDVPESFAVGAVNWTNSGMTLKLGGDGKLHAYQTGTMIDVVPPHNPAMVTDIQIAGRSNADDELTVDFSAGNPLPTGGLVFSGGSQVNGDSLLLKGTAGNDDATLTSTQVVLAGSAAIGFSGVEFFGFDLGSGVNNLLVDHATLKINRNDAISASTNVTVDGGILDFNGKSSTIGNLVLKNNGNAVVTSIKNATTTVASGTLTATSIVCDSLTIGIANMPTTRTWDGGGGDNRWSTAANWVGDVAPLPGDKLVFPAGIAKTDLLNDYPTGTTFGSIDVTGGNYIFRGGVASLGSVHVKAGTLTTPSIVSDSLTIGSAPGATATASAANPTGNVALQGASASRLVARKNEASTALVGVVAAPAFISGSPNADQIVIGRIEVDSTSGAFAAVASPSNSEPLVARSAAANGCEARPAMEVAPCVGSTGNLRNANAILVMPGQVETLPQMFAASLALSRDSKWFDLFHSRERLKDSVAEEFTNSLTNAKKQASIIKTDSVHDLALQSLMHEYRSVSDLEQLAVDANPLHNMRPSKQNTLSKTAIEQLHANSFGMID